MSLFPHVTISQNNDPQSSRALTQRCYFKIIRPYGNFGEIWPYMGDLSKSVEGPWMWMARDHEEWREEEKAYIQH